MSLLQGEHLILGVSAILCLSGVGIAFLGVQAARRIQLIYQTALKDTLALQTRIRSARVPSERRVPPENPAVQESSIAGSESSAERKARMRMLRQSSKSVPGIRPGLNLIQSVDGTSLPDAETT